MSARANPSTAAATMQLVESPRQAALLAAPVRQRILAALETPGSATTVARDLGLTRQVVGYHVRELEKHGFLELEREEMRRGCTQRILRRTARYLVAAPEVFGRAGLDVKRIKDKFSSAYLAALATRMAQDVGRAEVAAAKEGKRLATLSADVEVRFRTPQDMRAYADELLQALAQLSAKYHDDTVAEGRSYRVIVGAYPFNPSRKTKGISD